MGLKVLSFVLAFIFYSFHEPTIKTEELLKGNWENQIEGTLKGINFLGDNIVTFQLVKNQKVYSYQKLYRIKKSDSKELILEIYSKEVFNSFKDKVDGNIKFIKVELPAPKIMKVSFGKEDNQSFNLVRKDLAIFH